MKTFPKIIFMGTPDFAVPSLQILLTNGYPVVALITAPDKPAGRGQKIQESALKKFAKEKNLNILQPSNLKEEKFIDELKSLKADLQIVVAFRMLPEIVWNMPPKGTFNLHASLLPQYRGAAPINWAIINGEKESGVTTFFLKQKIDTGNIIFQEKIAIEENETAGELHDKLMVLGADLVLKTVQQIEGGELTTIPQDNSPVLKDAPKIFKQDCEIDWRKELGIIHNFIRGLSPYPTAHTTLIANSGEKHPVKIFKSSKTEAKHEKKVGTLSFTKDSIQVAVKKGFIIIHELQLAGKKRMSAEDFLRGFDVSKNWNVL